jgi:hypothetical protein
VSAMPNSDAMRVLSAIATAGPADLANDILVE